MSSMSADAALRITVTGPVVGVRDQVRSRALELGLRGWVRLDEQDAGLLVHAEGPAPALEELVAWLEALDGVSVDPLRAGVEGHEQFAMRGVHAGVFVVQEHQATAHHFD